LEAPRQFNGTRVNLRLDSLSSSYSLFPGQIVKVKGINASGRTMVATSLSEGCPLKFHQTSVQKLLQYHHLGNSKGRPLQIMTVSGPFTTSNNLEYEPLTDFLMGVVKENQPDVVIMMGPFIDLRQATFQKGKISLPLDEDTSTPVSFETLFVAKITSTLEQLFEEEPDLITQFVLVPSLDDAASEPVYPQPPLTDRIPNGKQTSLPSSNGIELGSLFLQNIENIPSSYSKKRIHCVSNPCTIQINEIVIGITSTDALLHISSDETNHKLLGNRMSRIAQHLIQQRSYYPLFPPATSSNLNLCQMNQWSMQCTPDIMIIPSKLACFCHNVLDCVVVNPGQVSKGMMGGNYGVLSVYPMDRATLEGVDEKVEMGNEVYKRIRVDIRKI